MRGAQDARAIAVQIFVLAPGHASKILVRAGIAVAVHIGPAADDEHRVAPLAKGIEAFRAAILNLADGAQRYVHR